MSVPSAITSLHLAWRVSLKYRTVNWLRHTHYYFIVFSLLYSGKNYLPTAIPLFYFIFWQNITFFSTIPFLYFYLNHYKHILLFTYHNITKTIFLQEFLSYLSTCITIKAYYLPILTCFFTSITINTHFYFSWLSLLRITNTNKNINQNIGKVTNIKQRKKMRIIAAETILHCIRT